MSAYRFVRYAIHQAIENGPWPHWAVYRIHTDKWRRTWQCEWDGCQKAQRAYTSWGALAKAARAFRKEAS